MINQDKKVVAKHDPQNAEPGKGAQEERTGVSTTDGFTIDESGRLNNFAVEPEMYVEDK